jgi:hypothetical protein
MFEQQERAPGGAERKIDAPDVDRSGRHVGRVGGFLEQRAALGGVLGGSLERDHGLVRLSCLFEDQAIEGCGAGPGLRITAERSRDIGLAPCHVEVPSAKGH